ncbi:unnamed protein product, partial [Heterotrigona itama]
TLKSKKATRGFYSKSGVRWIMHSTTARSNRSTIQSSISSTSAPSSLVHPQQQQILYGPIANPTVTLQPCGNGLHPSCIYPGAQRNAGLTNPAPLHIQG